ncbi:ribonuclease H1-like [Sitophilus oryzae]|uniref:ribonuclease H n=1 Tax=Sitophilus oryzae TaxID=7048 RepID=A0A6J2YVL2_SITOR|nr:ribonuclease H1-like [Sitophilus oryzae]
METDDRAPCFKYPYNIQIKYTGYIDSNLSKNSPECHKEFDEMVQRKFHEYEVVFTDASKDRWTQRCGIGIYNKSRDVSMFARCSDLTSICTAEIQAIRYALTTLSENAKKSLIVSDSKSALQSIVRSGICYWNSKTVLETKKELEILEQRNILVQLIWVPSHSGIRGNEEADRLALKGRNVNNRIDERVHCTEIFKKIKD